MTWRMGFVIVVSVLAGVGLMAVLVVLGAAIDRRDARRSEELEDRR